MNDENIEKQEKVNEELSAQEIKESDSKNETEGNYLALGISLGMCFGATLGMLFDNLALGSGIGMCFGISIGSAISNSKKDKNKKDK